jgi:hypothetical protein
LGKVSRDQPWFNLKNQNYQPSTPSSAGHFTHFYGDAFNGGSCLNIETNEVIKLFTSEFRTEGGIIFSYTFKREHLRNDLEIYMNVINTSENRERQIICSKADEENGNKIHPVHDDVIRSINIHLANNGQMAIPSEINNWITRFYILKFYKDTKIVDIGVKKIYSGKVLLGQMSFYSAKDFENEIMEEIIKIKV